MYEIIYRDLKEISEYESIIKKVLIECFEEENLTNSKLYISMILTTPDEIQKINKQHRNIDEPTDVLSFPMFEKEELEKIIESKGIIYEDVLGDIVVSIEKVTQQAMEYGHVFERELSYMIVHGFYHLMGYDHIEENDKIEMRKKEKVIMKKIMPERI